MMDTLPNELLLHIFRFLPPLSLMRCRLVCHRWQQMAEDDHLWVHRMAENLYPSKLMLDIRDHLPGIRCRALSAGHRCRQPAHYKRCYQVYLTPYGTGNTHYFRQFAREVVRRKEARRYYQVCYSTYKAMQEASTENQLKRFAFVDQQRPSLLLRSFCSSSSHFGFLLRRHARRAFSIAMRRSFVRSMLDEAAINSSQQTYNVRKKPNPNLTLT